MVVKDHEAMDGLLIETGVHIESEALGDSSCKATRQHSEKCNCFTTCLNSFLFLPCSFVCSITPSHLLNMT
jgi:hypothetical protein